MVHNMYSLVNNIYNGENGKRGITYADHAADVMDVWGRKMPRISEKAFNILEGKIESFWKKEEVVYYQLSETSRP